jgi:uncharacterized hydantoinase/oxoprolinase family protein
LAIPVVKAKRSPANSIRSVHSIQNVIVSGHGDFLVDAVLKNMNWHGTLIRLRELLGPNLARSAPAYALSMLASEEIQHKDLFERHG